MKNILLTIAYDGTDFCGWQKQPGQRSVQSEIESVLSIICAQPIQINGTSRTDAGVHAYGQRANFHADFRIPTERIPLVANGMFASAASEKAKGRKTAGEIAILKAEEMPDDFHARFQAVGKKYVYKIVNSPTPDPFQRNYCCQVGRKLDLEAMKKAAKHLIGTHDFKCFQAAGGKEMESTVRTIFGANILETNLPGTLTEAFQLEITGDGFLYNMVRIITGTLIDIGLGKKDPDDLPLIIERKDRTLAGHTAPPQGLYLQEVFYEKQKLLQAAGSK